MPCYLLYNRNNTPIIRQQEKPAITLAHDLKAMVLLKRTLNGVLKSMPDYYSACGD